MIFPSIDKLLNIVTSKYELVNVISTRSKEMHDYKNYQLPMEDYKSKKDIGKAMEELEKGLIKTKNNYEEK